MIKIGTRGSDLALTQSRHVAKALEALGLETQLVLIKTQGDRIQHLSLDKLEGKGFFTTEIEQALLTQRVDLAVHSLKDLPGEPTEQLVIASIPKREAPHDCLVINASAFDPNAPVWPIRSGARIGTSASRRKAQTRLQRPDLKVIDIRGNVPTRISRLDTGGFDALILAAAGLNRLELKLHGLHLVPLAPKAFVPAPGQGALALQCRSNDSALRAQLARLHHPEDGECVACERGLLRLLKAGCHVPLGAHAQKIDETFILQVFLGATDDNTVQVPYRFEVRGQTPEQTAQRAFDYLGGRSVRAVG